MSMSDVSLVVIVVSRWMLSNMPVSSGFILICDRNSFIRVLLSESRNHKLPNFLLKQTIISSNSVTDVSKSGLGKAESKTERTYPVLQDKNSQNQNASSKLNVQLTSNHHAIKSNINQIKSSTAVVIQQNTRCGIWLTSLTQHIFDYESKIDRWKEDSPYQHQGSVTEQPPLASQTSLVRPVSQTPASLNWP